jgi:hypothetical protein
MKLLIALCCLVLTGCGDPTMQYRLECQLDGVSTMSSGVSDYVYWKENAYSLLFNGMVYYYHPHPGESCKIAIVPRKH